MHFEERVERMLALEEELLNLKDRIVDDILADPHLRREFIRVDWSKMRQRNDRHLGVKKIKI